MELFIVSFQILIRSLVGNTLNKMEDQRRTNRIKRNCDLGKMKKLGDKNQIIRRNISVENNLCGFN
jgi:hypothetical protein